MSIENPGDDCRCDHCNRPGQPYTYKGQEYSGLVPYHHERLCSACVTRAMDAEGVNILVRDIRRNIEYIYNTKRDADKVLPLNPVGTEYEVSDGRDMRHRRLRRAHKK